MAIFHCEVKVVSRADNRSSIAAAAYRSGEKIKDQNGKTFDYSRKQGVLEKYIVVPNGEKVPTRSEIWNMVERSEKRKNSTVAREYEIALPEEFNAELRKKVCDEFSQYLVNTYNIVADVCIHAPGKHGDQRNYHAHILTTTRKFENGELTDKTRILDVEKTGSKEIIKIRNKWANICNQYLDKEHQISPNKVENPTIHLGKLYTKMERKGIKTDKGNFNRLVIGHKKWLLCLETVKKQSRIFIVRVKNLEVVKKLLDQRLEKTFKTPKKEESNSSLLAYNAFQERKQIKIEIDELNEQIKKMQIKIPAPNSFGYKNRYFLQVQEMFEFKQKEYNEIANAVEKVKAKPFRWLHRQEIEKGERLLKSANKYLQEVTEELKEATKQAEQQIDQVEKLQERIKNFQKQRKQEEERFDKLFSPEVEKLEIQEQIEEEKRRAEEDIKRQREEEQKAREHAQGRRGWHR